MQVRVSYVWHDHECYIVRLNDEPVGMLFKTHDNYWTFRPRPILLDDELEAFLKASFDGFYCKKLIIAKREVSKKLKGWCG